jgi:hypothetical protein
VKVDDKAMASGLSPIEGPWTALGEFDIVKVVGLPRRLSAVLESDGGCVEVIFEDFYGYRLYNESDLIWYWNQFGRTPARGVYRAEDSEHYSWAAQYSVSPNLDKLFNTLIVADDVLDVLAWSPPVFRELQSLNQD